MAETKYTYSIATDTANALLASDSLEKSIRESAILHALASVVSLGDVLDISFRDAISAGDKTTLDGLVSAHTGVALEQVIIQRNQTIIGTDVIKTRNVGKNLLFTKNTTTYEYISIDFKYLRGGFFELKDSIFGKDDFDIEVVSKGATPAQDTLIDPYLSANPVRRDGNIEIKSEVRSSAIPSGLHLKITYRSDAGATLDVTGGITLYGYNDA